MDRNFWEQACNASVSRPVSELKQSNYIANAVAVSYIRCKMTLPRCLLTQSSDFRLRIWCRVQRDILFAGLQTAAVEAERREVQRGGGRPRVEEPAAIQRLDVRWLRGRACRLFPSTAEQQLGL